MEHQRSWPDPRVWSASPVVWGALLSAAFWSAQFGRVLPQHWKLPPASRGPSRRILSPYEGLSLLSGAWGTPNQRMPIEPKLFLAIPDACALRPSDQTHHKTRPCAKFALSVGCVIDNWPDPLSLSLSVCLSIIIC